MENDYEIEYEEKIISLSNQPYKKRKFRRNYKKRNSNIPIDDKSASLRELFTERYKILYRYFRNIYLEELKNFTMEELVITAKHEHKLLMKLFILDKLYPYMKFV